MTLKSYTDFVIKYALVPYVIRISPATEREKEDRAWLRILTEELASLIGPENWEKLIDIFMEKVSFPKGFDKHALILEIIYWERSRFMETLAEFCEPLIERTTTAEKPEGGQDAAKA